MSATVVISGGDGFIGSHLTRYLVECGYKVYALVMKGSPLVSRIADIDSVTIIEGDLDHYEEFFDELPRKPRAFLHFAWAGVSPEERKSVEKQRINLNISLSAVEMASKIGAEKFIFPGSTMEYSLSNHIINDEAAPSPQNAYGAVKISTRYLCSMKCKELGLNFVYAVISSIYSEDRIDNNVVYYTISTLLKREKPKLTKLEQLWDYVHIDDVMLGLRLIIEKGKDKRFYCIGHGDNWPLSNYILKIRDIIDPTLPLGIGEVPYEGNRLPMSCVDLSSIIDDTGFTPQIDFEQGIRRVIEKVKDGK